jgi:tetratricopeptide (TPR) repeat protein
MPVLPPPSTPSSNSPPVRGAGPARPEARIARVQALGTAAAALVRQARAESAVGDFPLAAATLERALRIEPDHPQLWLELGQVRQAQHNYAQAEVMGRKALSSADDHATQALAWRLIAASLEARGLTREAAAASEKARQLGSSS